MLLSRPSAYDVEASTAPLLPFPFVSVCVSVQSCSRLSMCAHVLDHIGYMCINGDAGVNMKSAAKHRLYLKKRNSKAHSRSLLRNELIQSPDTIRPISYIIFSLSFTIHQLSLRLIYEAYFIFREFSDDRKLISSALVLLLTVAQSQSGQS